VIAWRVTDVAQGRVVGQFPVAVTTDQAIDRYPDLSLLARDETELLAAAAARDTWRLVTPHVHREWAQLALPWMSFGASEVRTGNAYARQSRWAEAQRHWQNVLQRHPGQHAAVHNLALAAAAQQDLSTAKQLAQQALRMHPCAHYEETVVWIERHQRAMTDAFQLAPPPEGWLFSPLDPAANPAAPPTLTVLDEEATAPPRWTPWRWLTQPLTLR
jgi:tetratricopeptide (TPR) repeat protein